ncbi:poly(R)-hydroxyalkanoic acid synthase subunit PhaE [Halorhabdus amylolytica]|uniref:poly(R)-hydroxyalkanoic acid synthase subunit PhaE n=1 Tax=Halorhabdus amylolytica TaxID=2559573 RepID=UPI0010AB4419|nr:poly(R)-hydroxyalkanoic acid synthase subunit PhaE [Halorhabdus amylolytica]
MSDKNADIGAEYSEMIEEMNEAVAESIEQNMKSQAAFVESWTEAMSDSMAEENELAEGVEGYNQATEVWMDAAERMFERSADAAQGEEVDPTEFRDIWLQSANEAAKEIMGTSAFAAANGQLIQSMLEMRQQADDVGQETIAELGFPTRDDVDEVGERLVELERRQHEVEEKLDRILEAIEE